MGALNERIITALVLLLLGSGLLVSSYGQQFTDVGGAFSPVFFPRIVLFLWVALAAADLVGEVVRRQETELQRAVRVATLSLAALLFLFAMPRVGFFLSATPFALFALITLQMRNVLPLLGVGVGAPAALVVLFNHTLALPLPTSPFAWWF